MTFIHWGKRNGTRISPAFSIIEVLVSIAVFGIMIISLYVGFSSGFAVVQLGRENLRATQVLQEKMETIRLYSWDQINSNNFIPATFQAPFYAVGTNQASGITYSGTVQIASAPLTETYSADMRRVTVTLTWMSGNLQRQRQMETFISRYGLQNYIY